MAIAHREPELTEAHVGEYLRLTSSGHPAGRQTMQKARSNVAAAAATAAAKPLVAGGGPEDPVADAAAVTSAARSAVQNQRGGGFSGRSAASIGGAVSSPSATAQTLTRLIWAVALGLIVLEVASQATGQYWSFNLPASGSLQKQPYQPLYGGATAAALPGILGGPPAPSSTPGLKLVPGTGGQ